MKKSSTNLGCATVMAIIIVASAIALAVWLPEPLNMFVWFFVAIFAVAFIIATRVELQSRNRAVDEKRSIPSSSEAEKHYRQRQLVTKSMRYDILKRDGFKCKICGRSAKDGVILHVDHIKPISKGGKSVPENLQTLCSDCNLGKSDKY